MKSATTPPIDAASLLLDDQVVHLLSGGEAPMPRAAIDAYRRYADEKGSGLRGRAALEAKHEAVRARLGRFIGLGAGSSLGFLASASAALVSAVAAFDWREGDNIVVLADDFPSVVLAGTAPRRYGVELRIVGPAASPEEALLAAVDTRTRLVCTSHVSFRHGLRIDVPRLAEGLRPHNVALALDASHTLGVLAIPADHCDIIVSCGHKFMLGSHGTGILAWNETRIGKPWNPAPGWCSVDSYDASENGVVFVSKEGALAFELGNPDYPSLYALDAGLDVLEAAGPVAVERHALQLSGLLREHLAAAGWPVWTPVTEARRGTSIAVGIARSVDVADRLAARGILVASGEGRIRLSIHGFNSERDVDAVMAALPLAAAEI